MDRRKQTAMRFWRRRKSKRLANLALLLIELEHLAGERRSGRASAA